MTIKDTWSWSRVHYTCLSALHQNYIQGKKGEDNLFNTGGSFCHNLCELAGKKELTQKECFEAVKNTWYDATEDIESPFAYKKDGKTIGAHEHYYNKILPFFSEENTNWMLGETISIEEHLEAKLPSGVKFQGHLDRVSKQDGKLQLRDYKISKRFTRNNIKEKVRQLYAYSYLYKEVHGVYPDELIFEFFQDWSKPYIVPFKEAEMWEAIEYIENRIKNITGRYNALKMGFKGMFLPAYDDLLEKDGSRGMFCGKICGYRHSCAFISGDTLKKFKQPDVQDVTLNIKD